MLNSRHLTRLTIMLIAAMGTAFPASARLRPEVVKQFFDAEVAARMKTGGPPGVAVAVVQDGRLLFAGDYGISDVSTNRPVVADRTIFRIGSITKTFTAVAALQLVDAGKLSLNRDVNHYLTSVKVPATYAAPITLHNLLTHSAGLDDIGHGRKVFNAEQLKPLNLFLRDRLIRRLPPGQVASYGTYAPTLAGMLVQDVSRAPLRDVYARRIFEPLAMGRTYTTFTPDALKADLAIGYERVGDKWEAQPYEYFHSFPASDIDCTVTDMGKFLVALLNGNNRLIGKSTRLIVSRQFGNHPGVPGWAYGMNESWAEGLEGFEHGGSMMGYSSLIYLLPSKRIGLVVLSNSESALGLELRTAFLKRFFPNRNSSGSAQYRQPTTPLAAFSGSYQMDIYCHSCGPEADGWKAPPLTISHQGSVLKGLGSTWRRIGESLFEDKRDNSRRLGFRVSRSGQVEYAFNEIFVFERIKSSSGQQ